MPDNKWDKYITQENKWNQYAVEEPTIDQASGLPIVGEYSLFDPKDKLLNSINTRLEDIDFQTQNPKLLKKDVGRSTEIVKNGIIQKPLDITDEPVKPSMSNKTKYERELLNKSKRLLEVSKEDSQIKSFWEGLKSPLIEDQLSFGFNELFRLGEVYNSSKKAINGETLNKEDEDLLRAYATLSESEKVSDVKLGYDIGNTVSMMIPYMAQFAMTSGIGTAAKEGTASAIGSIIKNNLAKNAIAYTAGAAAQAPLLTMGYADFLSRRAGSYEIDDNGNAKFIEESQQGIGESAWKAYATSFAEVFGEGFGEVGKSFLTKAVTKKGANSIVNSFKKAAKWDGALWETAEEYITSLTASALTGETDELKYMFSKEGFLNVFIPSVLMGGVFKVSELPTTVRNKTINKKFQIAEQNLNQIKNPEIIQNIKDIANLKDPKEQSDLINNLTELSNQEKAITLDYIARKIQYDQNNEINENDEDIDRTKAEELIDKGLGESEMWSETPLQKERRGKTGKVLIAEDIDGNIFEIVGRVGDKEVFGYTPKGDKVYTPIDNLVESGEMPSHEFSNFINQINNSKPFLEDLKKSAFKEQQITKIDNYLSNISHENGEVIKVELADGQNYFIITGDIDNPDPMNPVIGINEQTQEKKFIAPESITGIKRTQAKDMRTEMIFETLGEIDVADQELKSNPAQFIKGQEITYNGKKGIISDVSNVEEGIGVQFEDESKYIKPEEYQNVSVPKENVQQARDVRVDEETTLKAIPNEDGTFTVGDVISDEKQANKLLNQLSSRYANSRFEIINEIDKTDPFAENQYKIIARPNEIQETKQAEQKITDKEEQQVQESTTEQLKEKGQEQSGLNIETEQEEKNQKLRDLRESVLNEVRKRKDISAIDKEKLATKIFTERAYEIDENFISNKSRSYGVNEFLTPNQTGTENINEAVGENIANLKEKREILKNRGFKSDDYYMSDAQVEDAIKPDSEKQFAQDVISSMQDPNSVFEITNFLDYDDAIQVMKDIKEGNLENEVTKNFINYLENSYKSRILSEQGIEIDDLEEDVALHILSKYDGEINDIISDELGDFAGEFETIDDLRRNLSKEQILKLKNDVTEKRINTRAETDQRQENVSEVNTRGIDEGRTTESVSTQREIEKQIQKESAKVNTNPTDAQKEAGNYQKGHVTVQGLNITIENPKGSIRSGIDSDGETWETKMNNAYGYFKRTQGKDGDQIDTFLGDNLESPLVFIVDQIDPKTKEFDESKVMLGFKTIEEAKQAYLSNYAKDWKGLGKITELPIDEFKVWLNDGKRQNKAFSEYVGIINKSSKTKQPQTVGEFLNIPPRPKTQGQQLDQWVKDYSNDPLEIYASWESQKQNAPVQKLTPVEELLFEYKINRDSFINASDANNITDGLAKQWLTKNDKKSTQIDIIAQDISERANKEVTTDDIVEIVLRYPDGKPRKTTDLQNELATKYKNITGENIQTKKTKAEFEENVPFKVKDITETENFKKWAKNAPVLEGYEIQNTQPEKIQVFKVYHGTTNEFYVFDPKVKGNYEGHYGMVNYFTSDEYDAQQNYAGEGPDLTNRIEQFADQKEYEIEQEIKEEGFEAVKEKYNIPNDMSKDDYHGIAKHIAKQDLHGGEEKVLEVFVRLDNPVVVGGANETWITPFDEDVVSDYESQAKEEIKDENGIDDDELDSYDSEIQDRFNELIQYEENRIVEAATSAAYDNGIDPQVVIAALPEEVYYDTISATDLDKALRTNEELSYETGKEGEIISNQVISDVFKNLGFDGIVLVNAQQHFHNMEMDTNASHIHVFDGNESKIKLSDGTNVNFDPDNRDIRFKVSEENIKAPTEPKLVGELFDYTDKKKEFVSKVQDIADKYSQDLNSKVNVIQNEKQLPESIQKNMEKRGFKAGSVPGVYNPTNGEVYLMTDHLTDTDEAKRTVLHELVAHKGLRALLGKDFNPILQDIYDSMSEEDINRIAKLYNTDNPLIIADEYLAEQAENDKKPNFIQRAISQIKALLRRLFRIKYSDVDIDVLLSKSREYLQKNKDNIIEEEAKFRITDNFKTDFYNDDINNLRNFTKELKSNYPELIFIFNESQTTNSSYLKVSDKEYNPQLIFRFSDHPENFAYSAFDKVPKWNLGYNNIDLNKDIINEAVEKHLSEKQVSISQINNLLKKYNVGDVVNINGNDVEIISIDKNRVTTKDIKPTIKILNGTNGYFAIMHQQGTIGKYNYARKQSINNEPLPDDIKLIDEKIVNGVKHFDFEYTTYPQETYRTSEFIDEIKEEAKFKVNEQTKTKAFKEWFGDSKVVDENGEPLVVYHGTTKNFDKFDLNKQGKNTGDSFNTKVGFYFTPNATLADDFTKRNWTNSETKNKNKASIIPSFLSIQKPVRINARQFVNGYFDSNDRELLISKGYDGVIIEPFTKEDKESWDRIFGKNSGSKEFDHPQYIAFSPTQIKSATGNIGTFDATNPDIRFKVKEEKPIATLDDVKRFQENEKTDKQLYKELEDTWFGNRDWEQVKSDIESANFQEEIKKSFRPIHGAKDWKDIDKAIHIYLDTQQNPDAVKEYYEKLTPEQKRIVDISQNLTKEQKNIAQKIREQYDVLGEKALDAGVIRNIIDNYVGRAWDLGDDNIEEFYRKFGTSTRHAKQRTLGTIIEGMAKGYKLKTEGATNNLKVLKTEINNVIENKKFIKLGKATKINGQPLFSNYKLNGYEEIRHPNFKDWAYANKIDVDLEEAKLNRDMIVTENGTILTKQKIYAPKEIANKINNVLQPSALKGKAFFDFITKWNAIFKSTILQYSFFHHFAFTRSYLFGGALKKFSDINIRQAYKYGLDAMKNMEPEVELLVRNGLTVGRIQDWDEMELERDTWITKILEKTEATKKVKDKINNLRKAQTDFLFNKFGAGLKVKAALLEYRHLLKKYPEINHNELAKMAANLVNDDFGGLHLDRIGRDKTYQHIFRLLALAADWTESNVRAMVKAFGPGTTSKEEQRMYQMFWGRVFLRAGILTTAANLLLAFGDDDEDPTDDEFNYLESVKKRYQEAWDRGYLKWMDIDITPIYRIFSDNETNNAYFSAIGHFKDPLKFISKPIVSAKHKASVFGKMLIDALTGTDWRGKPFTSWDEFLGLDKYEWSPNYKGEYKASKEGEYRIGEPKGGKLKGQLTKSIYEGKPGTIGFENMLSFIAYEFQGMFPVPLQNAFGYMTGDLEGFEALGSALGTGATVSERRPETLATKYKKVKDEYKLYDKTLKDKLDNREMDDYNYLFDKQKYRTAREIIMIDGMIRDANERLNAAKKINNKEMIEKVQAKIDELMQKALNKHQEYESIGE